VQASSLTTTKWLYTYRVFGARFPIGPSTMRMIHAEFAQSRYAMSAEIQSTANIGFNLRPSLSMLDLHRPE